MVLSSNNKMLRVSIAHVLSARRPDFKAEEGERGMCDQYNESFDSINSDKDEDILHENGEDQTLKPS
jgi:hypothetical protein